MGGIRKDKIGNIKLMLSFNTQRYLSDWEFLRKKMDNYPFKRHSLGNKPGSTSGYSESSRNETMDSIPFNQGRNYRGALPVARPLKIPINMAGTYSLQTLFSPVTESPQKEAIRLRLRKRVQEELNREEKLVVILHYYEGMNMREIGATLDLPEDRVSNIHESVLERLNSRIDEMREDL